MQPKVIRIDGVIGKAEGEISAQMVREQLPVNGTDPIRVVVHSEGGECFEGFAIHDALAAYQGPKSLSIESSAFSIASFIPMAFDDVEISPNGYMMLHNPYSAAEGDDEALTSQAKMLTQVKSSMVAAYATRSGKSEEEIRTILKDETFFDAQQAVEMGLASRISGQSVIGRPFAKLSNLPHGVVAALFGAGSGGNKEPLHKGKQMSDSVPVAATLQEIKAAYPKAKADFIVKCLEKSLPMASVAHAAVEEMMEENKALRAECDALKADAAKAKAEFPPKEDGEEEPEEEKTEAKATARSGVKPVAKAKTGGPSAKARWESAIDTCLPKCSGNKAKAVAMANRTNPGLREAMLSEVNP